MDLTLGRQTASWATTLFLTPADPFSPFNPADPFRAYRGGIDAARLQFHPGAPQPGGGRGAAHPVGHRQGDHRPGTRSDHLEELGNIGLGPEPSSTSLPRPRRLQARWARWAVRGEASLRRILGKTMVRGTLGIDRRLTLSNRDRLPGWPSTSTTAWAPPAPAETSSVLESEAFTRGELQVLGRDEAAAQAQYQLHPLWSLSLLWLRNLNDRSSLLAPSLSYSASKRSHPHRRPLQGIPATSPRAPRDRPPPSTAAWAPPPTSR